MKRFSQLLPAFALILLGLPFTTFAGDPTPLPPTQEISGDIDSIEDLFSAMGVTRVIYPGEGRKHPAFKIDKTGHFNARAQSKASLVVYPDIDIVDFETNVVKQFIDGAGVFATDAEPASHRAVIVLRYGFDNKKAVDVMVHAKRIGIHSAVVVTDGPITMDKNKAHFPTVIVNGKPRPDNYTNDIRPEYLLHTGQGKSVKALLNAGYDISSPTHHPLANPDKDQIIEPGKFLVSMSAIAQNLQITPIMHEKEIIMAVVKDPAKPLNAENLKSLYVVHGTANWTHGHYNRNFIYRDNLKGENGIGRFALEHALSTVQTFTQPGSSARINDIPTPGLLKVVAKDGTFLEQAYTDGRYELNVRIAQFLTEVATNPESYHIEEVVLSHFVSTNRAMMTSLSQAWEAMNKLGRPFKIRGLFDQQFIDLQGYGVAAAFKGYDVRSASGAFMRGFSPEFAKSVLMGAHFEEIPGAQNIDLHGEPLHRILWHDKTTWIRWRKANAPGEPINESMVDLWTGSYNASGNKSNLERQDYLRLKANSSLSLAVHDSIMGAESDALKRNVAAPLEKAIYISTLSDFLGQSPMDLDWGAVEEFQQFCEQRHSFGREDAIHLEQLLKKIAPKPTRVIRSQQVSSSQIKERLRELKKFYAWAQAAEKPPRLGRTEFLHLLLITGLNTEEASSILSGVLWYPGSTPDDLEKMAADALKAMGKRVGKTKISDVLRCEAVF